MEKTVKLILASLLLISLYSCNSSHTDDPNYVYKDFKNFSLKMELSSDTVVYGGTVWAKLIIKNNSDEKDSIAYIDEALEFPMVLKADLKDTTWMCDSPREAYGVIVDYFGGVPYTVFKPAEEKYYYIYFKTFVYRCWGDTTDRVYYHYIIPADYKVSAHVREKVSENTLNLKVVNNAPDVFLELTSDYENRSKYSEHISVDSAIEFYDSRIEKYKDTPYENEFFLNKLEFVHNTGYRPDTLIHSEIQKLHSKILEEIDYHIAKNPDAAQVRIMLDYYRIFRFRWLNDESGAKQYLKNLQVKYRNKRVAEWCKEFLEPYHWRK